MPKNELLRFTDDDVLCLVKHWYFGMQVSFIQILVSCNKNVTIQGCNGIILLVGTPLTIIAADVSCKLSSCEQVWPPWTFTRILEKIIHMSSSRDSYIAQVYDLRNTGRMTRDLWSRVSSFHMQPTHITTAMQCGHEKIREFISISYRKLIGIYGNITRLNDMITSAINERWMIVRGYVLERLMHFVNECQIQSRACTDIDMCDMVIEGCLFICVSKRDRILLALLFLCEESCMWLTTKPPDSAPDVFHRIYTHTHEDIMHAKIGHAVCRQNNEGGAV